MRTFKDAFSIVLNTKGEIALARDAEGDLTAEHGAEVLQLIEKFAKEQKTGVSKWAYYCPVLDTDGNPVFETDAAGKLKLSKKGKPIAKTAPFNDRKAREGRTPVILANGFGLPYVALLPPQDSKPKANKPGKIKLA